MSRAPRIALVLGSGGPRGYAHIGVLRVLEEAGIVPELVVGSSVGALIGAFWASGLSAEEIDERSFQGGPLTVFDPNPFADRGWIRGQRLQNYVNRSLEGRAIEDLPRQLIVVAVRREDKRARFFMNGNTGVAVRASGAMPGILSPVGIQGIEYEDGDAILPVPVSAAVMAGAQFVIAVDVSVRPGGTPPDVSEALRERDAQRRARIEPEVALADFLIHPDLDYRAGPRRSYLVDSRARGEAHAREVLPELIKALDSHFGSEGWRGRADRGRLSCGRIDESPAEHRAHHDRQHGQAQPGTARHSQAEAMSPPIIAQASGGHKVESDQASETSPVARHAP